MFIEYIEMTESLYEKGLVILCNYIKTHGGKKREIFVESLEIGYLLSETDIIYKIAVEDSNGVDVYLTTLEDPNTKIYISDWYTGLLEFIVHEICAYEINKDKLLN